MVDILCEVAGEMECTPSQLALAWLIQQPGVTSAIIGPRTIEQFEDNFGSLEVELNEANLQKLNDTTKPGSTLFQA